MTRILSAIMVLVGTVAAVAPAEATSLYPMTTSELTYIADVIVEAEVIHAEAEWGPGAELIRTVSTLRIVDVIKGDVREGDSIFVAQWGGALDGAKTTMPSSPVYIPGERVVTFLEWRDRAEALYRTVGMIQGKYNLILEPDTGKDILVKLPYLKRSLDFFDESQVRPPAVRRYSEDFVAGVRDEVTLGFVPPYEPIPGVSRARDAKYQADAVAAGQTIDPIWNSRPRYVEQIKSEGDR